MRLTCPNCGAAYEVADGMVPASGRHVQCTECHTRWFVRGAEQAPVTEDQILRRLETLSPQRPRPVAVPDPEPEAPDPVPDPAPERTAPPPPPTPVQPRPPTSGPTKPGERPSVPRPGSVTAGAAPMTPPPPRPTLRLDYEDDASPAVRRRSRFGRGLVFALVLFGLALAAYVYHDEIAARVPAAGPALDGYVRWVDGLRDAVADRIDALRHGDAA